MDYQDQNMQQQGPNFGLLQSSNQQSPRPQTQMVPAPQQGQSDLGAGLGGISSLLGGLKGNSQPQGQLRPQSQANPQGMPQSQQQPNLLTRIFGQNSVSQANQAINQQMASMPQGMLGKSLLGGSQALNDHPVSLEQLQQQQQQRAQQNKMLQSGQPQQNNPGQINPLTINTIKHFEGYMPKPEWDVNAYRAGYGSDTMTTQDGKIMKIEPGMHVSEADAERDLQRRTAEFQSHAASEVGQKEWSNLPENVKAGLTSVTYNYGSLPKSVQKAVESGDTNSIADAVEGLAHHNNGVNAKRRRQEAELIRTGTVSW